MRLLQSHPVVAALSMLPAPRSSRLLRVPKSSAWKSGPQAGPRRPKGAHRTSWSMRRAAGDDETVATSTPTTAVAVAAGSVGAPALPSLPPSGVGTTALDASALPALDAAVSLPVEPSSSSSSSSSRVLPLPLSGAVAGGVAAAHRGGAAPASDARPSPLFEIPPAVAGMLAINLGAALFGSNMVAVKLAQAGGASPAALSAGRFALAAALFVPSAAAALRREQRERRERRDRQGSRGPGPLLSRSGLELGLYLFGGYTGQAVGLSMTTASRGAFASAFTVLAVPMLQAAAVALSSGKGGSSSGEGEGGSAGSSASSLPPPPPVPASTWVAAAAAVAGVFLLTSDGGGGSSSAAAAAAAATATASGPNLGDLLCVLSAVLFGVHKWRSEQLVERLSSAGGGGGGGRGERAEGAAKGRESCDESSSSSSSGGSSNEETVRSLVALQLCVLALASIALCAPEAASAVKGALADQRGIFGLAASAAPSAPSPSAVEFSGAVAYQLWSEFSGLPWPLFAYMGLFT